MSKNAWYNEDAWYDEKINKLVAQYGPFPPPYVLFPKVHPFEICWRMGDGQDHMSLFFFWSAKAGMDDEEWLDYFRRFPPPHLWLMWMIHCIWCCKNEKSKDGDPEDEDHEDADTEDEAISLDPFEYDYWFYFRRTAALDFGTEWDCRRAWVERDGENDNKEEKTQPKQEEEQKIQEAVERRREKKT